MEGGVAEDVVLTSVAGDGAKLVTSAGGTVLRDGGRAHGRHDQRRGGAQAADVGRARGGNLRNVTALAPAVAGIRCETSATLVNTLVRGAAADVDASKHGTAPRHSPTSAALLAGPYAGTGNQERSRCWGRPPAGRRLADDRRGHRRPAARRHRRGGLSACARRGARHRRLPVPPSRRARRPSRKVPDATTPRRPSYRRPRPAPSCRWCSRAGPGRDDRRRAGAGQGAVADPGPSASARSSRRHHLPVGSEIDARLGRVRLVTAVTDGLQGGTFGAGASVRQRRAGDGMTSLVFAAGASAMPWPPATAWSFSAGAREQPPRSRSASSGRATGTGAVRTTAAQCPRRPPAARSGSRRRPVMAR